MQYYGIFFMYPYKQPGSFHKTACTNLPAVEHLDVRNMSKTFLFNKTSRRTNFLNLFLSRKSTCFGQFLCPSSGFFHCTFGTGICHAALMTAFKHDLVVLKSCLHTLLRCTVTWT